MRHGREQGIALNELIDEQLCNWMATKVQPVIARMPADQVMRGDTLTFEQLMQACSGFFTFLSVSS